MVFVVTYSCSNGVRISRSKVKRWGACGLHRKPFESKFIDRGKWIGFIWLGIQTGNLFL